MARPYWSGQIQISLVSFGVSLFPATEAASQIAFHQIDRRTGERIRHQNVAQDQEAVDRADIVKGYEVRKGEYVTIEPEEIAHLRIPSKKTLEIVQFIKIDEIDPAFFEKPYFVVPQNDCPGAGVCRDPKSTARNGQSRPGRVMQPTAQEHLIAITKPPEDKHSLGLMAYTLRYRNELRNSSDYFSGIKNTKVDKKQLSLAKELIQRSTAKFVPTKFEDDYEAALRELIDAKIEHHPLPQEEKAPKRAKVINLMDALRKSVGELRLRGPRGLLQRNIPLRKRKARRSPAARNSSSPMPGERRLRRLWRPLNQRKNRHGLAVLLPSRSSSRAIARCATST